MARSSWQNRWKITARLTTTAPLHIGGDLPQKRDIYPMAETSKKKKETVDVSSIVTDCNEKPYLPGSTIKGNIRAWMEELGYDSDLLEAIFGSDHSKKKDQVGGKIEFCDAFWNCETPVFTEFPPYWKKDRLTGITASVSIDRATGTACDKKLFHLEYVPPGVSFNLCFTGQDLEKEEITLLCHALENGFAATTNRPITFGASTANGWGQFVCKHIKVEFLDATGIADWLKNPGAVGYAIPMTEEKGGASWLPKTGVDNKLKNLLEITLRLSFDGPFLVNDQSKSKKATGDDHDADMNPRRGTDGKVVLPAESFRGAFRSQAERIIRTISGHACTPNKPCKAVKKISDVQDLCLACRIFGASGWKTAVTVPQFTLESCSQDNFKQEFVAIDRFTGGSRKSAKFNAMAVVSPIFTGTISIDLQRITSVDAGLLALTMRDLLEGDIRFGFGGAKGYGACSAKIVKAALAVPPQWKNAADLGKIAWKGGEPYAHLVNAISLCVKDFCEVTK